MPPSATLRTCAHVNVCESRALNTLSIASAAFCVARSSFGDVAVALQTLRKHRGHAERADGQHTARDDRLDE